MEIQINWIAVVIATAIGTIVAGIWYQEPVFGKVWRRLTGVTAKQSKQAGNTPIFAMLLANFITAIALAFMLNILSTFFENHTIWFGLLCGLVTCLAFSITTLIVHNGFELKPRKLTFINSLYQFVLFLSMTLTISLFGV